MEQKPVIALKAGNREPGAREASSHTDVISGMQEAYEREDSNLF
ncbi:hypothetical protein [Methanosarcina sp. 1.H.T.1A.1]|jgi:acetyl-CoA synthetase (ADP-forming)|nr:hypothetical protein [Methanosarcina sp. 1.H.T.1A.1]